MAHTNPDYTTKGKLSKITASTDNAELAVRLGSPVSFDRRGNVVWLDDFEGAILLWTAGPGLGGGVAALTAAWANRGSQSCELTAGAGAFGQARIYREFYLPRIGLTGLESSFTVDAATDYVQMDLRYYDGSGYVSGGLRYDRANTRIEYRDNLNAWIPIIDPYTINTTTAQFNTWKFVIDPSGIEYVRILVNDREIDMTGIPLYDTGVGGTEHFYVNIRHDSANALVKTIYVDDVILTINEP